MEGAAVEGISKLYEYGGLVCVLVLMCLACGWLVKYLLGRNDVLSDKMITVIESNTAILTKLTEKIDDLAEKN